MRRFNMASWSRSTYLTSSLPPALDATPSAPFMNSCMEVAASSPAFPAEAKVSLVVVAVTDSTLTLTMCRAAVALMQLRVISSILQISA